MTIPWPCCRTKVASVASRELAGLAEVAEICGVAKRTAVRYTNRKDFPKPVSELAAGPVWRTADVARWAQETLPLREGRPPS